MVWNTPTTLEKPGGDHPRDYVGHQENATKINRARVLERALTMLPRNGCLHAAKACPRSLSLSLRTAKTRAVSILHWKLDELLCAFLCLCVCVWCVYCLIFPFRSPATLLHCFQVVSVTGRERRATPERPHPCKVSRRKRPPDSRPSPGNGLTPGEQQNRYVFSLRPLKQRNGFWIFSVPKPRDGSVRSPPKPPPKTRCLIDVVGLTMAVNW